MELHKMGTSRWKLLREMMTNKKICLYGASGHGKVVAEIAEDLGYEIVCFIDDNPDLTSIWDYPVERFSTHEATEICISLGSNLTRKQIVDTLSQTNYISLVSPKSNVSKRARLQEGTVVMAGVTINSDVKIGKHCIINTNASIDHDCVLEDFVHI